MLNFPEYVFLPSRISKDFGAEIFFLFLPCNAEHGAQTVLKINICFVDFDDDKGLEYE